MSDEFIKIARQEIQTELNGLEGIITRCNNDEQIFKNSKEIEEHLHKIKGLAPMMGQEIVGKIAKISDTIMKHIIEYGTLTGSHKFLAESIESMKNLSNGQKSFFVDDIMKIAREAFPQISNW
jgi:chemotaxis protein histidine kinase CheA